MIISRGISSGYNVLYKDDYQSVARYLKGRPAVLMMTERKGIRHISVPETLS